MTSKEIREKYIKFFTERDHSNINSASLIPENDPTTLFTGSGMQPILPYLLGEKHPAGDKLVNLQKCFRAEDIDDIGDNRHTTFFEMMGNWSLGAYFKKEQIPWFFEFLTKEIGLDARDIYVTAFIGDQKYNLPRDTESVEIWKGLFENVGIDPVELDLGSEENAGKIGYGTGRIFYYDGAKNWWSRAGAPDNMPEGEPGGPDTEIFYKFPNAGHDTSYGEHCHPNCDCGQFMEIGNSVFMEYKKVAGDKFEKLPQKNIDFGGGFERITAASENKDDVYTIDIFDHVITALEAKSGKQYKKGEGLKSFRIIADHLRAVMFMISDGVAPSNTDKGYFVRRLIRRAIRHMDLLGISGGAVGDIVDSYCNTYAEIYPGLLNNKEQIMQHINEEEQKFRKTLQSGISHFNKIQDSEIGGKDAFVLFSTYGLPIDIIQELAEEAGKKVDIRGFERQFIEHQKISRAGGEEKFKGGLRDTSEMSVKYHTATHLLNAALREVLGNHVLQKGSNITPERLRFDFSHDKKMTDEEKARVEEIVNQRIEEDLSVTFEMMSLDSAKEIGAMGVFDSKYENEVKVYRIGDEKHPASVEICGGPHVNRTGILGKFKITKEESVAQGIRRIKATLS